MTWIRLNGRPTLVCKQRTLTLRHPTPQNPCSQLRQQKSSFTVSQLLMAITPLDDSKAKDVIRQVEFYFSESNLPIDKFLNQTVQESEDGLVSLALICSFTKMRNYLGLGEMKAEDVPQDTVLAVAEALKISESLKVSEDGKRVGRSTELPDHAAEQVDCRTIAVSPLPHDVKIDDMESFFSQHGKVNSVRLPRLISDKRYFCGTALVELSDEEDAKKIMAKSLVYAGVELEIKPKKDFNAERDIMWKEYGKTQSNKGRSNGSYQKGLIVAFKLNRIQSEESTKPTGDKVVEKVAAIVAEGNDEGNNTTSENADNNEEKSKEDVEIKNEEKVDNQVEAAAAEQSKENNDTPGSEEDVVLREDIRAILGKFGKLKYVEFSMGDESGYIRFDDPDTVIKARALAALDDRGGFLVKNHILTLEPLNDKDIAVFLIRVRSDDAEEKYWKQLNDKQDRSKDVRGNNRERGGVGSSRGGRGFNGKRQHQDYSESSNKARKTTSNKCS